MKVNISPFDKQGRKIHVKIDGSDVWSWDHTLAYIILPGLLHLKVTKHGIPSEFANVGGEKYNQQQNFDFYEESHDEAFDEGIKRWDETLDKMIWSFQQILFDDWELKYQHGNTEFDWVKTDTLYHNPATGKNEDTFQMIDKNPGEHWTDYEGMRIHEERIQEGLELFGKYYRHLWD